MILLTIRETFRRLDTTGAYTATSLPWISRSAPMRDPMDYIGRP